MVNSEYYAYKPDYAIHPGEYLEEVLESRSIKKRDLSERLGISEKHLSQIINKQALITSAIAVQLEKILSISANIWNNLNSDYSLFEARLKEAEELKRKKNWINEFPVKDLRQLGILPQTNDKELLTERILQFFGIPGPEQWTQYYKLKSIHFRKSTKYNDNLPHMTSWLRTGELFATNIVTESYNRETLKNNLNKIRQLTINTPRNFESEMKKLCAESGVALVFVPEFQKTHISGATRWLTSDKALIVMSLRYKSNDHFWFTFFHEAAHIILHSKKDTFIDNPDGYESPEENEANRFSRNILIPENEYLNFIEMGDFHSDKIRKFASRIKIHPGIIVGRLQYDKYIKFSWHNDLKDKFEIVIPGKE